MLKLFQRYDVFVSYAVEDKGIAEKITAGLRRKGIKVYFAGNEFSVGDPVSAVVSKGLRKSRYGIVILSPFYTRQWTLMELYSMIGQEENAGKALILPVWHEVDYEDAVRQWPILQNRWALLSSRGYEHVIGELYRKLVRELHLDRLILFRRILLFLLLVLPLFLGYFSIKHSRQGSYSFSGNQIRQQIDNRIRAFQAAIDAQTNKMRHLPGSREIPSDSIIKAYDQFTLLGTREQNKYSFSNGYEQAGSCYHIRELTGIDFETPFGNYTIGSSLAYLLESRNDRFPETDFFFKTYMINREPVSFQIDTIILNDREITARVFYTNNIRSVSGTLSCCTSGNLIRKQKIDISGFKPSEDYIFSFNKNTWTLSEVK